MRAVREAVSLWVWVCTVCACLAYYVGTVETETAFARQCRDQQFMVMDGQHFECALRLPPP